MSAVKLFNQKHAHNAFPVAIKIHQRHTIKMKKSSVIQLVKTHLLH